MKNLHFKNSLIFSVFFALVIFPTVAFGEDAELAKGKEIYNGIGACSSCHGADGKGDGAASAALNPKPRSFASGDYKYDTDNDGKTGTETDIFNILTHGAAKFKGSPLMAARPDIPEADRKALVKYVLSLKTQ